MPIEFDDQGLGIFGLGTRGLRWYDDVGDLRAELYLDQNGQLNLSGLVISGGQAAAGGGSSGGGSVISGAPVSASYLTLAADGSLSSERVFTPGSGLSAVDGGAGGAYTLSVDGTVVRTTRQVATDATLSGGGDLSANRTLGLNLSNANTWAALQTFGAGVAISGANALTFGGDVALSRSAANILTVSSGDRIQSANYVSGISGYMVSDPLAEFENARIRGEFRTAALVANEMQAYAGTLIIGKSAGVLAANCTTAASIGGSFTVNAKDGDTGLALFAVNDILWMKTFSVTLGLGLSIFCTVTAVGAPSGGARNYTCTLNSGSTSATIPAGSAILDYGPSGSAAISFSADGAIGSSANISIFGHSGTPWTGSSLTHYVRLGNLNGSYGQTGDVYGIGIGTYHPTTGKYLFYDTARGLELRAGAGAVGIDDSGIRLTKGNSSAVGAIKFFDSTAFSSQVGGLSVDRGTYADALLFTDATAFDQYARTQLTAIGDTSAANSRREQYLEVNTGAGSRWGVIVYGGGTDAAAGGGLQVSAGDQGQVGIVPRGEVRAQVALRVGSWSAGVFTQVSGMDNAGNIAASARINIGPSGGGQALVEAGDATHTGSIQFWRSGVRHGFFGYSVSGILGLTLESGSTFSVSGGPTYLNTEAIASYEGVTASVAAGGGSALIMQPADGQVWLGTCFGSGGDMNWRSVFMVWMRFGTAIVTVLNASASCTVSGSGGNVNVTNNDGTYSQAFRVRALRLY